MYKVDEESLKQYSKFAKTSDGEVKAKGYYERCLEGEERLRVSKLPTFAGELYAEYSKQVEEAKRNRLSFEYWVGVNGRNVSAVLKWPKDK